VIRVEYCVDYSRGLLKDVVFTATVSMLQFLFSFYFFSKIIFDVSIIFFIRFFAGLIFSDFNRDAFY